MSLPKKTNKRNVRKLTIFLGSLLVLVVLSYQILEIFIEQRLEGIINSNPEREYDLRFESLDLSILSTKVRLDNITIIPLDQDSAASRLQGSVTRAELNGFGITTFIMDRKVVINELKFVEPIFEFVHTDRVKSRSSSSSFQDFFGDVISRGEIKNFSLTAGMARLMVLEKDSLREIGSLKNLNILAEGLSTDSVRLNYAIPFEFQNIHTSWQDFSYSPVKGKTFHVDDFVYDFLTEEISVQGLQLKLDGPWQDFAKAEDFQGDVIDFYMKSLKVKQLKPSTSFYDSISFSAEKIEIDSLVFRDGRDKNKPRPKDVEKKNFAFLLKNLQVPIELDSITISNSTVIYEEIEEGSSDPGRLDLTEINALLINVTSMDSLEKAIPLSVKLNAKLNQSGKLSLDLVENYEDLSFKILINLSEMKMNDLNPLLENLAGIRIHSGQLGSMTLQMESEPRGSQNKFAIEYSDLNVEILKKGSKDKSGFISSVAKAAYHKNTSKDNRHYREPEYFTERNIYRGPINLIWLSAKDGLLQTIPTGAVRLLLPKPANTSRERKKEERKARKASKKAG